MIARFRRSLLAPRSAEAQTPGGSSPDRTAWQPATNRLDWIRRSIPLETAAIELSGEVRSARKPGAQALIARLRFVDAAGNTLAARSPKLLGADKDDHHFFVLDHLNAGVFRFVCLAPKGATQVDYAVHLRHASERFGVALHDIRLRPLGSRLVLDAARTDSAADPVWRADRQLRSAIATQAEALLATSAPLRAEDSPFSEAVIEHFILDTHDVALADRLADRRLKAGRDREALTLLGVSERPRLRMAASRRDLLSVVAGLERPAAGRRTGAGRLVLATESAVREGGGAWQDAMTGAGWALESCGTGAASSETGRATDVEPHAVRALSDRFVSQGRGRDPGLIWTDRLGDALAGADAASRLDIALIYDATDIADEGTAPASAAWATTDSGRLEEALYRGALAGADLVISRTEAGAAWLKAKGVEDGRLLLVTGPLQVPLLEARLSKPRTSAARRRTARAAP